MALLGAQFVNAVSPNPVGSLQAYAGASAPTGWLLCDGTSYSTSVYPELYSVLGYTYGGSGANFNVPDLRGRVPIGAGNDGTAANNASRTRGAKGGDTRLQSHGHGVSDPGHAHGGDYSVSAAAGGNQSNPALANTATYYNATRGATTGISIQSSGSGSGENMPPFLVTNYIIKAVPDAPRSGLAYGSTPPIVTQLPANPQFGDVVTYIADAANGVAWNLQYDASGTYPWKFVGGAPLYTGPISGTTWSGSQNTASVNYTTTGFTTCSITAPLPGDYDVTGRASLYIAAGHLAGMFIRKSSDATTYSWGNGHGVNFAAGGASGSTVMAHVRFTAISASELFRMEHASSNTGAAAYAWGRTLTATPVRVKAA